MPTNADRLISGGGAESKLVAIGYSIMLNLALPSKADRRGGLSLIGGLSRLKSRRIPLPYANAQGLACTIPAPRPVSAVEIKGEGAGQ